MCGWGLWAWPEGKVFGTGTVRVLTLAIASNAFMMSCSCFLWLCYWLFKEMNFFIEVRLS